jgi:uncharacterized protein
MIYLDSAAVVKLVHAEADSEALRQWTSSVLVEIETVRALARHAPDALARLPPVLDLIDTVDLQPRIRRLARTVAPTSVRSLGAVHLATALHLGSQLAWLVTYDKRLADAATSAGLPVSAPT